MENFPILAIMTLFMGAFINSLVGRRNAKVRNAVVFTAMAISLLLMALLITAAVALTESPPSF